MLESPTGTLTFYYKDISQEIVRTLLFEEYSVPKKWVIIMDTRQDSNATFSKSGPSAQDRYCDRMSGEGEKTAWKRRRIETRPVSVIVMFQVLTYVVAYTLF